MSFDIYSHPIKVQSLDQKSQRTSLQKGGFASMMNVLVQNEAMNQEDNDGFVLPEEICVEPIQKIAKPIEEKTEKPVEEAVIKEPVLFSEDSEIEDVAEELVFLAAPSIPQSTEVWKSIPIEDMLRPEVKPIVVPDTPILIDTSETFIDIDEMQPIPTSSPIPTMIELPKETIEVELIEEVPEAIEKFLTDVFIPQVEPEREFSNIIQKEEIIIDDPHHTATPIVAPTFENHVEKKEAKKQDKPLLFEYEKPQQYVDTSNQIDGEMLEDPKIRFVRYVEEEIKKPVFQPQSQESLHIPEELLPQEESVSSQNASIQTVVSGTEKSLGQVATKTEATQVNPVLEKGLQKEEQKLPKQKLQQSFAKLLKQAQEEAAELEERFHTEVLKKLDIQVKDPAGVIQLEVAQKEAVIHIRAVAPMEAMNDLHYLGQDLQGALQDLGLQLGSYELKSQDERVYTEGLDGAEDIALDDAEELDVIDSNYVVDKKI